MKSWECIIKLTRTEEGVCQFDVVGHGDPSWVEVVGLLEIHKADIIRLSRERAARIEAENKKLDSPEEQGYKGDIHSQEE